MKKAAVINGGWNGQTEGSRSEWSANGRPDSEQAQGE
ncbi:hypothetical protein BBFGKLBO_01041 [Synechococcus sp. CBW1107]|nr:hypothetical protein BBFGKLBO_01041 [Synechococcus sp. CBW1107]